MRHACMFDLPHYNYDDYAQWEGRWELIEGIPHAMTPAPSIAHQWVSNNMAGTLREALRDCPHCRALLPVDWRIADDTVVQPDNLVICHPEEGAYITRAPALIVEILSRSTAHKDRHGKFALYEREGVRHYLLVDAEHRLAKVYQLVEGRYVKRADVTDETLDFDLGPCRISLDFSSIW